MESGKQYNIGQILSGNNVLQIPDMQRDYCWANTYSDLNGKSLVFNFLNDLIDQSETHEELQMGLMYAYESPKHYIQLCDGQQRLTTIYLIISLLYKKLDNPTQIKECILTNSTDEIVPRFQYSIRETTMSFLTDFVKTILRLNKTKKITSNYIKKQDWYFNEYNQDPSIQNLLTAIDIIEEKLEDLSIDKAKSLSDFLLGKVSFLYFDMQNRTFGEEQFVVLNTTGKPLTKTENLKPKFLENFVDSKTNDNLKNYAEIWEDWEDYFWLNKSPKHKNADFGLNEFFRWVFIIEQSKKERETVLNSNASNYNKAQVALGSNHFNILDLCSNRLDLFNLVNSYFVAINTLFSNDNLKSEFLGKENRLGQIDNFVFLPLLAFTQQNKVEDVITNISFKRLNNFLRNRKKDDNVRKASITTSIEAIRIATLLTNEDLDIANYKRYESVVSSTLLNPCEKFKFNVLRNTNTERELLENTFWKAENLVTTNGNIQFIFEVLDIDISKNDSFIDLKKFIEIYEVVSETLEKNTDLMRRALLTFGNYSIHHGYSTSLGAHRYTLGNTQSFYGDLANNGDNIIKNILISFLREVNLESSINVNTKLETLINQYAIRNNTLEEETISKIIKNESLLKYMNYKLFCISNDKIKSYALDRQKTMGEHSYEEITHHEPVIETL